MFDQWGTIVRCDIPLSEPVIGTTTRLVHDGTTWSIANTTTTLAAFPSSQVVSIEVSDTWRETRSTPGWAIVLGVIGLAVFLLGALLFFVKTTKRTPAAVLELRLMDGRLVGFMPTSADPAILRTQMRR